MGLGVLPNTSTPGGGRNLAATLWLATKQALESLSAAALYQKEFQATLCLIQDPRREVIGSSGKPHATNVVRPDAEKGPGLREGPQG